MLNALKLGIGPFFAFDIEKTVTITKKTISKIIFLQILTFLVFEIFTILPVKSKVIEIEKPAIPKNNP